MSRTVDPIVQHVSPEELNGLLKKYSSQLNTPAKARKAEKRVTLIRMRLNGVTIEKCAENLGISERTCYNIQREWNEKGEESIIPRTSTGARPKLKGYPVDDYREAIRQYSMTVKEAAEYIRNETGKQMSENQVRRIFRDDVKRQRNRK
jgi:transposase